MTDLRTALETELGEKPDDLATHRAYADFLMEHDDPRGELIQVQMALEDATLTADERKRLQGRETDLLAAHQRQWLGELAPVLLDEKGVADWERRSSKVPRFRWRRGWLDDLYLFRLDPETARALVRCPLARLLQRLHMDRPPYNDEFTPKPGDSVPEGTEYPSLYLLAGAPFLPRIRFFQLGDTVDFTSEYYDCRTNSEGVIGLIRQMDRVEELHLLAHNVDTTSLFSLANLDNLRVLLVYHSDEYNLEALAGNPAFGRLVTVRLHPGHRYSDSALPREQVRHLLRSPHLKSLAHLHLHASDLGDEGVEDIIGSGILKRLKVLDLTHGCIRDEGARRLAECPEVEGLELLDLTYNEISEETAEELESTRSNIRCGQQYDEPDSYLFSGDME